MSDVDIDPRRLVAEVDMSDLVIAYASGSRHPFAVVCFPDETVFICPCCGHTTNNGGTARIIDARRWHCWRCHRDGTRYQLERIVLEDAEMLAALCDGVAT